MTYAQARDALRGTLRFGDDYQIRALNFLADVAEIQERIEAASECGDCHGRGVNGKYCNCDNHCRFIEWIRCQYCHGTGHLVGGVVLVDEEFSCEVWREATEELYLRNYRQQRGQ